MKAQIPDSIEVPDDSGQVRMAVCPGCLGQRFLPVIDRRPGGIDATECFECDGLGWVSADGQSGPVGV